VSGIYFDEHVAAGYDASSASMFEPSVLDATVDLLADLAGDGAALELAVGTGRVAIPLAARGVPVSGIDLSPFMLEQLRAKPEAAGISIVEGDMTTTRVDGAFRLVYLVFNTIMNLMSQDEQVACFENAADHLEPGGHFVIEVGVPDLRRLPPGERYVAFAVDGAYAGIDEYTDIARQEMYSHHFTAGPDSRVFSMPFRYVWPSELDLMARIAGMRLVERWADWDRSGFTGESRSHVSIWQKRGDRIG
jgi:SAM-dependent methyltransferase